MSRFVVPSVWDGVAWRWGLSFFSHGFLECSPRIPVSRRHPHEDRRGAEATGKHEEVPQSEDQGGQGICHRPQLICPSGKLVGLVWLGHEFRTFLIVSSFRLRRWTALNSMEVTSPNVGLCSSTKLKSLWNIPKKMQSFLQPIPLKKSMLYIR